jgi:hypothetical protein
MTMDLSTPVAAAIPRVATELRRILAGVSCRVPPISGPR